MQRVNRRCSQRERLYQIVHIPQAQGGHSLAIGVTTGRNQIGPILKELTCRLLDNEIAPFGQDCDQPQTELSTGHKGLDLVHLPWGEIATFGIGVDNQGLNNTHGDFLKGVRSCKRQALCWLGWV